MPYTINRVVVVVVVVYNQSRGSWGVLSAWFHAVSVFHSIPVFGDCPYKNACVYAGSIDEELVTRLRLERTAHALQNQ